MESEPALPAEGEVPDVIARSIRIAAPAETVFSVVSEPGWFVNDGEYREHEISLDGSHSRVTDPVHGTFSFRTEVHEAPDRVRFRWLGGGLGEISDAPTNTVEFVIDPGGPTMADGVVLTVRERGFAGLSRDLTLRRRNYEENLRGWEQQLEVARDVAEARHGGGAATTEAPTT